MIEQILQQVAQRQGYCLPSGRVVLARKNSLPEYEFLRRGLEWRNLTKSRARDLLKLADFERVWASHERQLATWRWMLAKLQDPLIIEAADLYAKTDAAVRAFESPGLKILIAGDEGIGAGAGVLGTRSYLLPVIADEQTSDGALGCSPTLIDQQLLGHDRLKVEEWQKVAVSIDGVAIGEAVNTVFIGDCRQLHDSFLGLKVGSTNYPNLVADGVLVVAGLGSTGWFRSAAGRPLGECEFFERSSGVADNFFLYVDQPFHGVVTQYQHVADVVKPGDMIRITSKLTSGGIVCIDSYPADSGQGVTEYRESYAFPRGAVLEMRFGANKIHCRIVDGSEVIETLASQEVYVGHVEKVLMSRYLLEIQKQNGTLVKEEQKSSGVKVATLAGASAWPDSSCLLEAKSYKRGLTEFSPELKRLGTLVISPRQGLPRGLRPVFFEDGQKARVSITATQPGMRVVLDAYTSHALPVGASVDLTLSHAPCKVFFPMFKRDYLLSEG